MRHILVVCTANQCRSPMAAGLLRARAAQAGAADHLEVRSAGTWAPGRASATNHAVTAMAERGIDITGHESTEVDADLLQWADLVLVMTASHREALAEEFPASAAKIVLFSALNGGEWDVADPVGGTLEDYRATARELARLIDVGWDAVCGQDSGPRAARTDRSTASS